MIALIVCAVIVILLSILIAKAPASYGWTEAKSIFSIIILLICVFWAFRVAIAVVMRKSL